MEWSLAHQEQVALRVQLRRRKLGRHGDYGGGSAGVEGVIARQSSRGLDLAHIE